MRQKYNLERNKKQIKFSRSIQTKVFQVFGEELEGKTFAASLENAPPYHHQNCCFKQNENSSFILFCKKYFFKGIPNSSSKIAMIHSRQKISQKCHFSHIKVSVLNKKPKKKTYISKRLIFEFSGHF